MRKNSAVLSISVPPSEHGGVEIFFKALEFGFDFRFGVFLGVEDLHAGRVGGQADGVEGGSIAGDKFDQCGLLIVGKLVGEA